MITTILQDKNNVAKLWTCFCLLTLVSFILTQNSSYMEIDALSMWVLSCAAIIYLSRKDSVQHSTNQNFFILILGFLMCSLSFISIPLGITNPPYSIGEFSLFLSGLGVILFTLLNFRSLIFPVSIPFIAVIGYGGYEVFVRNQEWITAPLIPIITLVTNTLLNFIGINSLVNGNIISFMSQTGSPISLSIVSDCTGIWSLGTFTISIIIVFSSFPPTITKKCVLLIAIGYFGTFVANITRILLIALAGFFYGPAGVIEDVHIHIGWIIFTLWMIIFWYYYFTRQVGITIFKKGN
jgi:exosortase/archaeosortase family protein